jgi:hypothetical protein
LFLLSLVPGNVLQARQRAFIRLWFPPHFNAERRDYYVFINNEGEQSEECLHIRATYARL